MKKVVLSLVAAMIAVVSFAQPLALKSAQQKFSMAGAKLTTVEKKPGIHPMHKNLQAPSTRFVNNKPRKAEGEFTVAELAGDYISAMYVYDEDSLQNLEPGTPACRTGMVSIEPGVGNEITIYGLLSVYGYDNEYGVKATVNLDDFTFTIPNNQVVANDEKYGPVKMVNVQTEGDFTGKIYSNGIHIEQIWMGAITIDGEEYRYSDYFETMLLFPNGVMSYKDDEGPVEAYVTVDQDPETKALTVYNFGNLGAVVDIDILSDKTFSVDYMQVVDSTTQGGAYHPFALIGEDIGILTGKCTENTLVSDNDWTFYSEKGWWYGQMGAFKIELAGELEFPEVETGELVVAPEGLKTEDYPMTATFYDERQNSSAYSTTVKLGWDGKTVYIQGLDKDYPQAWVKGTLDEENYVGIAPTFMGTKDGLSHFFGAYSPEGIDSLYLVYDADAKTFSAAGTVMIYKGLNTSDFVCFYNGFFLGVKPSPVALPAGVETVDMPFTGKYFDEDSEEPIAKTGTVKVGRDGQDLYIGGLFDAEMKESGWIKGTFANDTVVVFEMNQYLGDLKYGLSAYLVGYNYETEGAGDVVMVYNKANNFYTAANSVILTRFKSSLYNITAFYQAGLTIGVNPASISNMHAVKADKSGYYTLNGVRVERPTQKGVYIHNGKKFVVK